MIKRASQVTFLLLLIAQPIEAQETGNDQHTKVAMRLIGDRMLSNSGDKSSRVLPVVKEGDRYRIVFESKLRFIPNELVNTIREVVHKAELAQHYIVEVEQTESKEVVYSFEINNTTKTDLIPCANRRQPLAHYAIYFTSLDGSMSLQSDWVLYLSVIGLVMGGAVFLRVNRPSRAKPTIANEDLVQIGDYQLDKRRMTLLYEQNSVELSSRETDLLYLFYTKKNEAIEREDLLKIVWGDEGNYIGRTLDVFVSKLRKRLSADKDIRIINVRGYGYKLIC